MTELVDRFTEGLPVHARRLEDAFDANDRETVRRLAHQLKGSAGGYGFSTTTAAAGRLEEVAREGATISQALADVCDLCRRARARSVPAASSSRPTRAA